MRARFERDVNRRTVRGSAGHADGVHLGVRFSCLQVSAEPDDPAVLDDDGADTRVDAGR